MQKACHHCVLDPVLTGIVHSSCQAFAEYLEEKLAKGQASHRPTELVLPSPSHTNLGATQGLLASCRAPRTQCYAHSKSWLLPQARAVTKKESKKRITLLFHREPKLAQHIISRQNVCYHQIHSSSLGAVIFASLSCVGKRAAKSLLSESTFPWRSKVYSLVFKSSLFILTVPIYGKKMAKR